MVNGVVSRKLSMLDATLAELESLIPLSAAVIESEWTIRRAVERDLQVLSEIVVDVSQRLLSILGESPAPSAGDAVKRCMARGVLSDREGYIKAVRMRNVIVHQYDQVDPRILADVVNNHLDEYRAFRDEVLAFVAVQEVPDGE
jgi:uncharacterized protein YutE (UPF0331/DUF86 family)